MITVVYFKRETSGKPLELFSRVGVAIMRAGCKGGLKSLGGKWYVEKKHVTDWTTVMMPCCKDSEEKPESISYKRALAMLYLISCKGPAPADRVAEWMASLTGGGSSGREGNRTMRLSTSSFSRPYINFANNPPQTSQLNFFPGMTMTPPRATTGSVVVNQEEGSAVGEHSNVWARLVGEVQISRAVEDKQLEVRGEVES
jgi:hypothetical protein